MRSVDDCDDGITGICINPYDLKLFMLIICSYLFINYISIYLFKLRMHVKKSLPSQNSLQKACVQLAIM